MITLWVKSDNDQDTVPSSDT